MSWGEFRTRLGQEFGKRAEYACYRLGMLGEPRIAGAGRGTDRGFFFAAEDVPVRIELLRHNLPEAIAETTAEADEILRHRFQLLGYRDVNYGPHVDWRLDAVHGKRAPEKPWYKIRFLDFNEVGDHKITWELNRHQHLVTLAKAGAITGDSRYVEEIERQFRSWWEENPYPLAINWGSSLEVAFRSLSWIWVLNLLRSSELSERFRQDVVRGLARNGQYIERYLSTYFSPNTHLIGEALALFFIGTGFPEIPASARWQKKGLNILTTEIQRQVRPDGVYFEQSLYYHVYALDMFLHACALAGANQIEVPGAYDEVLRKMLHVLDTLCRNGVAAGFGDDDGGRLFNPRRNRTEHMSDSLALGVCLLENALPHRAKLTEESIWIFGQEAVAACASSIRNVSLASCAFEDGGLYVIASSGAQRGEMLIDAGPHGIGHGGHGHADALSLRLSMGETPVLIDPGTYVYIGPGDERNQFRGTAAHNTVRVDQLDQAIPETPFSWSSLPVVAAEKWEAGKMFTLFSGSHSGYRRLSDPVLHRRMIFHVDSEYWLVRDELCGQSEHDLEIFWHFAPGLTVEIEDGCLYIAREDQQFALLSSEASGWATNAEEGWFSPAYGEKVPAPVGVFRARRQLPAEHATLIIPTTALQRAEHFRFSSVSSGPAVYTFEHGETADEMVFCNEIRSWKHGPISSDAEFLFMRREGREITRLAFCSGSFVDVHGQRVFSAAQRVRRLEWSTRDGVSASDSQLVKFFKGEMIRSGTPVR